jgi:prepilin-type N-terminal cleavage/methylation domain-containing protein
MNEQSRRNARRGFTLVELIVVIAIIGVLIGLILPAIQKARVAAQRAQALSDISQLSVAIANAKTTMEARYVPSIIASNSDFTQFFGTRFNTSAIPSYASSMNGNQCLVFFLGGYNGSAFGQGFSTNSASPFAGPSPTSPSRAPFYDFPQNRMSGLMATQGAPPMFLDPWGMPYFYMTSKDGNGMPGDYATTDSNQAGSVSAFTDASGKHLNYSGFQIVSAGPNMRVGPGGGWSPGVGLYAPNTNLPGYDDLSNFYGKPLGSQ